MFVYFGLIRLCLYHRLFRIFLLDCFSRFLGTSRPVRLFVCHDLKIKVVKIIFRYSSVYPSAPAISKTSTISL